MGGVKSELSLWVLCRNSVLFYVSAFLHRHSFAYSHLVYKEDAPRTCLRGVFFIWRIAGEDYHSLLTSFFAN